MAAVEAAGYTADLWDVDAQGVPHDLGVLGHYDAVLWYLGDNRITQDPEDELTETSFGHLPDMSVAERQQYLTIAVRDYLNEGGKLIHAGETAQYQGVAGISDAVGGLYYGLNGDPEAECVISPGPTGARRLLRRLPDHGRRLPPVLPRRVQRVDHDGPAGVGRRRRSGRRATRPSSAAPATGDNPLDEAGVFVPTSDVLPARSSRSSPAAGRSSTGRRRAARSRRSRGALRRRAARRRLLGPA